MLATAIQRLASEQTSESVASPGLQLPSDDMKGRIIGREGRNIRSFEQVTGVNLVIDDTPEAVLLSCFDPVRREVARLTPGGAASPTAGSTRPGSRRCTSAASLEVERLCVRAGEDAAFEMGITDLHPHLVPPWAGCGTAPPTARTCCGTSSSPATPPGCSPTSSAWTGLPACAARSCTTSARR